MKGRKLNGVLTFVMLFCVGFTIFTTNIVCAANKKDYIERYRALEQKCQETFAYDGAQTDMNADSYAEYKLWNQELRYVYKSVIKTLDDAEAEKLEESEKKWKKQRKKKAAEAAAVYEGGTMQSLEYSFSMITQTKKRIKWFIKNYT